MLSMLSKYAAYKAYDSMSKVKVTGRGQMSKLCDVSLVRAKSF